MKLVFWVCLVAVAWTAAGAANIVDVADYGAAPNDGADDTAAVAAAIAQCEQRPGAVLLFHPGRYDFGEGKHPDGGITGLAFTECEDLVVDGGGAEFMFDGLVAPLAFHACRGVTVRNLTIDFARPPFSVGVLEKATETYADFRLFDRFPLTRPLPVETLFELEPGTFEPKRRGLDRYLKEETTTEIAAPQVLRINTPRMKHDLGRLHEGAVFNLRHKVYVYNAVRFHGCEDATLENVTVYTAPGMGFWAEDTRNITVRACRIMEKPGSERHMSVTADAMHFSSCRGLIRVEDSLFERMGDDMLNVHGSYSTITEMPDERTLVVKYKRRRLLPYDAGDRIEFVREMLVTGAGTLESVTDEHETRSQRLVFTVPLPADVRVGDSVANASKVPRVIVRNCTVRDNRARGILIKARNVVVENNAFEGCTGAGLYIECDLDYYHESMGARNVVVRDNTFDRCNGRSWACPAVISVFAGLPKREYGPAGVHQNIRIENNTIRGSENGGIFIASTDGAVVSDNLISGVCTDPVERGRHSPIAVVNAKNIVVEDNTVYGFEPGDESRPLVYVDDSCEADTITVRGNKEDGC